MRTDDLAVTGKSDKLEVRSEKSEASSEKQSVKSGGRSAMSQTVRLFTLFHYGMNTNGKADTVDQA
jgi:hypothetical protein